MTSILHFADIHFGVEDRAAMEAIHDFALGLKPDLTLICGDITQDGKTSEFKDAAEWIKKFPGPKLITPGNHDTPTFNVFIRATNPFGRYDKYIKPLSEPFYADKNVMIVPMKTARGIQAKLDWSLGVVNMDILEKKIRQLHTSKPGTLKMIAVHHPLIYPSTSPLDKVTKNGEEAIQRLSDENIDAVISGHIHTPFFLERYPGDTVVTAIGAGTLSTRLRSKPASFNHIQITKTELSITAIDWIDGKYTAQQPWTEKRLNLSPADIPPQ